MKEKVKKFIRPFYHFVLLLIKLNITKTLYLNFKTQPLRIALKLPIFVFGKIKINCLKGEINICAPVYSGIIQFGKDLDGFPSSSLPIKLTVNGSLIFNGPTIISGGCNLTIWSGELEFGKFCTIGSGSVIKCTTGIKIGDFTRIVMNCVVMDSNVHYVKNIETGVIHRSSARIIVGKNCWINAGSIISKGTIIPDYSIIAQNSLLNSDYSLSCPRNSFLAGSPAKLKAKFVQRIFCYNEELVLNNYFKENISENVFNGKPGIYIEDESCVLSFFKLLRYT